MYQDHYFMDKSTLTYADSLAAYGLAMILGNIFPEGEKADTRLRDDGAYYSIRFAQAIQPEWVAQATFFNTGTDFILTQKMKDRGETPQTLDNIADYETHRQRRADYFEARKKLPKEALRPGATVDEFPMLATVHNLTPHPNWEIWAKVNQLSAISAYNGMVQLWADSRVCFTDLLKLILQMCATSPNNVEQAEKSWKKLAKKHKLSGGSQAAATQVFNPATGKGANKTKADSLSIGGQKNFWLLEYFKVTGMFVAGVPRVVQGAKDRKTYVLLPKDIRLNTSNTVFRQFQSVLWARTAIKMDIVAALKYTKTFLEQWLAGQLSELDQIVGGEPGGYVQGLATVYYKDMGSALAVMNQSTINLPNWMKTVTTKEEATAYINLLNEHEQVIQNLEESYGLEYDMLRQYRMFLSSGDIRDFFEFTAAYSSHLTHKIENRQYVTQFTTANLEVLVSNRNKALKPILENRGFQNVARAIRQATVNAQWAKIHQERVYEIHYGLGQDLKRKANYNDEFVQTLTDFMQSYNQENVQVAERYKGGPPRRRSQITTDDIADVIALIDEFGSKTVGNLLVAFGYAKASKEDETVAAS